MKAIVIQFNWRRNWFRRVAPHLGHELVQASLDSGFIEKIRTLAAGPAGQQFSWRKKDRDNST
jgi:hypothetical protein